MASTRILLFLLLFFSITILGSKTNKGKYTAPTTFCDSLYHLRKKSNVTLDSLQKKVKDYKLEHKTKK